jgi:hypothetical protein
MKSESFYSKSCGVVELLMEGWLHLFRMNGRRLPIRSGAVALGLICGWKPLTMKTNIWKSVTKGLGLWRIIWDVLSKGSIFRRRSLKIVATELMKHVSFMEYKVVGRGSAGSCWYRPERRLYVLLPVGAEFSATFCGRGCLYIRESVQQLKG